MPSGLITQLVVNIQRGTRTTSKSASPPTNPVGDDDSHYDYVTTNSDSTTPAYSGNSEPTTDYNI